MRSAIGAALPDELVLDRESSSTASCERMEQTVTEVFVMLRDPVYRYLSTMLHNPAEAEDLTQEAFLRLFTDVRRGRRVGNVRRWVFRVAHNLGIDLIRRRQADDRTAPVQYSVYDLSPSAEESLIEKENSSMRNAVLDRLSVQERLCFELRAEGLRYREIAEVLALRIPTVQTLLGRAVKKISGGCHEL